MLSRISAFLIGLLILIISCSEKEPIRIGSIGGLSGRYSELGVAGRNAVQMAIEETNQAGGVRGRKLILSTKDDMNSPEACIAGFQELLAEGAVAVIGPYTSNMAEATITSIKDQDILVVSPTISTDAVTAIDDNFIRVMPGNHQKALGISNIIGKHGHIKIAVTYDMKNAAFAETLYIQFVEQMKRVKPNSIIYPFPLNVGKSSFSTVAREIKKCGATALFSITAGIDGAKLCQQLKKEDVSIDVYGAIWMMTNELLTHGGKAVEGVRFISKYDPEEKTEEHNSFVRDYKRRYNREPSFSSYYAYEAVEVLIQALKESDHISPEILKQTILNKASFPGILETIVFNSYGDVMRKTSTIIIKDGAFVLEK